MLKNPNGFSQAAGEALRCVVIGEGTLPVICGELLRQRGHQILALISPDPDVSRWGRANGVALGADPAALSGLIKGAPFDYLLSIVNFQRLPASMVGAARRHAINYHDGPLPRYAGTHVTSWALLNGETRYAVTWHLMTGRTDAGDIVKQIAVAIEPDDTVLDLNVKCLEAAVNGFRQLLEDMEAGVVEPRRQDLGERCFFRRAQRPAAGCTLAFDAPAGQLQALLRALDFGPYFNPLGLPKIALGRAFAIVTEVEALESRSADIPGTIIEVTPKRLVITTASDDVALAGFFTIDGVPMSIGDVVGQGGLYPGARIGAVEMERASRLTALCEELSEHERFWLGELAAGQPTVLRCALRSAGQSREVAIRSVVVDSGSPPSTCAARPYDVERLLAAFVICLATVTGTRCVSVGFSDARLRADIGDLDSFFSTCLPLRVEGDPATRCTELAQTVRTQLARIRAHRTYARDAPLRDPQLRAKFDMAGTSAWPICVEILDGVERAAPAPLPPPGRVLTARFRSDGTACAFLYDPDVLDPGVVDAMSRQMLGALRRLEECAEPHRRMLRPQ